MNLCFGNENRIKKKALEEEALVKPSKVKRTKFTLTIKVSERNPYAEVLRRLRKKLSPNIKGSGF